MVVRAVQRKRVTRQAARGLVTAVMHHIDTLNNDNSNNNSNNSNNNSAENVMDTSVSSVDFDDDEYDDDDNNNNNIGKRRRRSQSTIESSRTLDNARRELYRTLAGAAPPHGWFISSISIIIIIIIIVIFVIRNTVEMQQLGLPSMALLPLSADLALRRTTTRVSAAEARAQLQAVRANYHHLLIYDRTLLTLHHIFMRL
jgi:hypothetical protein